MRHIVNVYGWRFGEATRLNLQTYTTVEEADRFARTVKLNQWDCVTVANTTNSPWYAMYQLGFAGRYFNGYIPTKVAQS